MEKQQFTPRVMKDSVKKLDDGSLPQNPWLNITEKDGMKVAQYDLEYIEKKYGSLTAMMERFRNAELDFSQMPEPFTGNRNAKVVCLNMNPGGGYGAPADSEIYSRRMYKNYRHELNEVFWTEEVKYPDGSTHDGTLWYNKRTRELQRILGRRPDIFFMDYFPYHSKNGFAFPTDLPSYEYRNYLLQEAMEQGKLIIIMRQRQRWYNLQGINLEGYPHKVLLRSAQSGYLTPNNFNPTLSETEIRNYF